MRRTAGSARVSRLYVLMTMIATMNVTSKSFDYIQTEILYSEGNNKCSISKDDIAL